MSRYKLRIIIDNIVGFILLYNKYMIVIERENGKIEKDGKNNRS